MMSMGLGGPRLKDFDLFSTPQYQNGLLYKTQQSLQHNTVRSKIFLKRAHLDLSVMYLCSQGSEVRVSWLGFVGYCAVEVAVHVLPLLCSSAQVMKKNKYSDSEGM